METSHLLLYGGGILLVAAIIIYMVFWGGDDEVVTEVKEILLSFSKAAHKAGEVASNAVSMSKDKFNSYLFTLEKPPYIFKRTCSKCAPTHKIIYYKRWTPFNGMDSPYDLFHNSWTENKNVIGKDYDLYSTLEDALFHRNAWTFANYADDVGFARDSGPNELVSNQWQSNKRDNGQPNWTWSYLDKDTWLKRTLEIEKKRYRLQEERQREEVMKRRAQGNWTM